MRANHRQAAQHKTPGPAAPAAGGTPTTTRWGAVVAVGVAIVLAALDMTIVAVALPAIGAELSAPPAVTQWVSLAYFLPMVALAIPVGRWLDRVRIRAAFPLAVVGFAVTSLMITAAPALWAVLAGRVLQGVFGALIGVLGFPVVAAAVRPEQRGRAISMIPLLITLSGVAGSGLGGLLTQAYGWRSVFLINIPVALVALALGHRSIPRTTDSGRPALRLPDRGMVREALVLGAAVAGLLLALDVLGRDATSLVAPALLALGAVLAAVAWARLDSSRPVVGFVRRPDLGLPLVALLLTATGLGASYFLVPYFLADVLGRTPQTAGLVLLGMAAAMAATSPVAGALADRFGPRRVVSAGAWVTLGGMLSLTVVGADAHPLDLTWRLALVGIGNGLFAGPNSTAILAATPPSMTATAGGVTALFRTLGLSLGPAAGALTWTLTGGGAGAFRAGAIVLTLTSAVAATFATPKAKPATTHPEPEPEPALEPAA